MNTNAHAEKLLTFAFLENNGEWMVVVRAVLVLKTDAVGGSIRETLCLFSDGGHESGGCGLGNSPAGGDGGGRFQCCAKGDVHLEKSIE